MSFDATGSISFPASEVIVGTRDDCADDCMSLLTSGKSSLIRGCSSSPWTVCARCT